MPQLANLFQVVQAADEEPAAAMSADRHLRARHPSVVLCLGGGVTPGARPRPARRHGCYRASRGSSPAARARGRIKRRSRVCPAERGCAPREPVSYVVSSARLGLAGGALDGKDELVQLGGRDQHVDRLLRGEAAGSKGGSYRMRNVQGGVTFLASSGLNGPRCSAILLPVAWSVTGCLRTMRADPGRGRRSRSRRRRSQRQ